MAPTKLIIKKLNNTISTKEGKALDKWLQESVENEELFKRLEALKSSGVDISEIEKINVEGAWKKVLQKYHQKKRTSAGSKIANIYKYAAIIIVFISLGYATYKFVPNNETAPIVDPTAITLQLENGDIQVLNEGGDHHIIDEQGNVLSKKEGASLDYKETKIAEKLTYNTLTVPYGKTFEIVLSDGTKVNLNAGSSLKYPVKFLKGKKRKVFLVGEAYFDVSEDKTHPFVVRTSKMNVEVLGTEFNVSAYPEDILINTVLVEGSVALSSIANKTTKGKELLRLKPDQKASWNKNNSMIKVNKVDTDVYTSWIHGRLVVKNMRFKNIIKKLERKYDVSIVNNNHILGNQKFTASFDVETIEEVLSSFAENKAFNFRKNDKTITINEH